MIKNHVMYRLPVYAFDTSTPDLFRARLVPCPKGTRVKLLKGYNKDSFGTVCRIDDHGIFIWVKLDKHKKDPVYKDTEFGPFIPDEMRPIRLN